MLSPLQAVLLTQSETKVLIQKVACRFALTLVNVGPTLASDDQKAAMCMDAFSEVKSLEPEYGEILY
jgi:hypothetical protein